MLKMAEPSRFKPGQSGNPIGGIMRLLVAKLGHLSESVFTQQAHVDCGRQGDQSLIGTDIGGGLLAADVLLSGGQGEYVSALSTIIHGLPNQAAGHFTDVFLAGGENAQVRPAEAQWDAKRLAFAGDDVCAKFPGGCKQTQGNRINIHA